MFRWTKSQDVGCDGTSALRPLILSRALAEVCRGGEAILWASQTDVPGTRCSQGIRLASGGGKLELTKVP